MVQYPIRLFDDFKLKFIKPSEVTTECDRSLNNEFNKTNFNRVSSGDSIIMMTFFPVMFRFSQQTTRSNQSQEIFLKLISINFSRSNIKENSHSSYRTRTKMISKIANQFKSVGSQNHFLLAVFEGMSKSEVFEHLLVRFCVLLRPHDFVPVGVRVRE